MLKCFWKKIGVKKIASIFAVLFFMCQCLFAAERKYNAWVDIPIIELLEYFGGIMATAYGWMRQIGALFGVIGISWAAFQTMMSRKTVKDLWWDTVYKWTAFFLLLAFYPVICTGVIQLANELGTKAGAGKEVIEDGLKRMRENAEADLEIYKKAKAALDSTGKIPNDLLNSKTEKLVLDKRFGNYNKYKEFMSRWDGTYIFDSKKDKEAAYGVTEQNRNGNNPVYEWRTLMLLGDFLREEEVGKEMEKYTEKVKTWYTLDLYLKDWSGDDTAYLSPAGILKMSILCSQLMLDKQDAVFQAISDRIDSDNANWYDAPTRAMKHAGQAIANLIPRIMTLFCCLVLILASIFAAIQYIMTFIEFTIITGIGAMFIPLMLFDGTKDIPKKLIPVFTSFFVKMLVITLCMMFVYYLLMENCINTVGDDGGINFAAIAEILLDATLAYVLTQNAPKIAQTILTGQPQLSMGEALAGAGTAGATIAGMAQAPGAALKGAAKAHGAATTIRGALEKSNAASKAAKESLSPNASGMRKLAAGALGRGAVAAQGLKDWAKAKAEKARRSGGTGFSMIDKGLQSVGLGGGAGGSGGGGAGGGDGSYGRIGTKLNGDSINNTSNSNFNTAAIHDENTGKDRAMTGKEFMTEKKNQGFSTGVDAMGGKLGQLIKGAQEKNSGEGGELPDSLSGETRDS